MIFQNVDLAFRIFNISNDIFWQSRISLKLIVSRYIRDRWYSSWPSFELSGGPISDWSRLVFISSSKGCCTHSWTIKWLAGFPSPPFTDFWIRFRTDSDFVYWGLNSLNRTLHIECINVKSNKTHSKLVVGSGMHRGMLWCSWSIGMRMKDRYRSDIQKAERVATKPT